LAWAVAGAGVLWLLPGRVGVYAGIAGVVVLLVLVLADWALLPGRRGLLIEREIAGFVGIGEKVEGTYTLRSAWPRALHVRVEDEMPPAVRGGVHAVHVDVPERGTATLPFEVSGMVRGLATLGRVGAQASTRLGLLASRATFAPGDTILVTPSVSNVRRFRLLAVQHRLHTAGVRVLRQRGESRAFAGLREYALGDDPRYIDWKATAKSMSIMVREHMREDEWRLTIVFDTAYPAAVQPMSASQKRENGQKASDASVESIINRQDLDFRVQFERAVSMAASLANHFILERAEVELITTLEQHDVRSGSGQEHLYKLLGSLATLQPTEAPAPVPVETTQKRRWGLRKSSSKKTLEVEPPRGISQPKPNGGVAWRLLDDVPVLRDERRFKVLITSAKKGTIPGHIWRSSHVVFMEDL